MDIDSDTLDRNAVRIVMEIGIPPCPAILTKLLRESRAEEPDFRRIARLVGGDVALASAMLKITNSPFYGLPVKASSVQQALALLGLRTVTHLVTGLLLRQAFSGSAGPGMEQYWRTSMATSLISALLSCETGYGDSGVVCTYALFRDCGMPVMLRRFPIYTDILDGSALTPGEPVLEIENERYTTNHARIGAQMARSWHLPESLCYAILHHHDVLYSAEIRARAEAEAGALALVAIGLTAEQLYYSATGTATGAATGAVCQEWALAGEWALSELELSREKFSAIAARVNVSINHL